MVDFDEQTKNNIDLWLNGNYDIETKEHIEKLLKEDPQKLKDAFYTSLAFGTGGLRGIMGVGTNRINKYTVMMATQGLANYLLSCAKEPSVIIGYDSRHNSRFFAEEAAKVLAGNGVKALIFDQLHPVPMVSYGCRLKNCSAGLMITASHNPPEYNGYKVYWSDGGQIVPPHDKGIIDCVHKIKGIDDVKTAHLDDPLIEFIKEDVDGSYLKDISTLQFFSDQNRIFGHDLKVVYTSLHGAGITMVPKALASWGFTNCVLVEEQREPDANFSTVSSPNPEEHSALSLGVSELMERGGDLLIGTDPDTDRVGVAVNHHGEAVYLNGNQIGCICLYHICKALGKLPENATFVKTIVTTELFRAIAESFGATCEDVLTGFKYIAEQIDIWEREKRVDRKFIFGAEESYGYLLGSYVRDKDGIIACNLICEVALQAKRAGKTLVDIINDIYKEYGIYSEELQSIKFKDTKEERERVSNIMRDLRANPPEKIAGQKIVAIEDYLSSQKKYIGSEKVEKLTLPKSNVLLFWFEDESKLVVRPSGTEPKIKFYCGVTTKDYGNLGDGIAKSKKHCTALIDDLKGLIE